jgi:uncharacterized phiE125 gp8 family phage protein
MTASWALVTAPVQEPISLAEAKQHAKIRQDNDDATLQRFIQTARETGESYMARGFFTQTWQLVLDDFARVIYLPRAAPLQNDALAVPSTAPVVQYYDVAGALQTVATTVYLVDTVARPGRIVLAASQTWPSLQSARLSGRVVITYVIGWPTIGAIPERIKQGMRLYVAYLDCDREGLEDGERARKAAESCWDDRVEWIEPAWQEQY